jgi:hypothetical protein
MKIFISYSSLNLNIADKIKHFLEELNISSFFAHDDIRNATDWKKRITKELKECNSIIPILTKDFKKSEWCSQELGIFYFQNKSIIPVSIDNTPSYGFINNIQARCIKDMPLEYIISEGLMDNFSLFTGFLSLLRNIKSFKRAILFFNTIEPYISKIKKKDLKIIIEESINNSQIWNAGKLVNDNLNKLLNVRKNDIDTLLLKKIKYQVKYHKRYNN